MLISFILTGMKNIILCFNKYFKWENFLKINYYNTILITTHHLFLDGNILSYLYSSWSVHSKLMQVYWIHQTMCTKPKLTFSDVKNRSRSCCCIKQHTWAPGKSLKTEVEAK